MGLFIFKRSPIENFVAIKVFLLVKFKKNILKKSNENVKNMTTFVGFSQNC